MGEDWRDIVWTDLDGRQLLVEEVHIGDPAGREVIGTMVESGEWFATTAAVFQEVWVQRMPPVSREQQERNRKKLGV